MLGIDFAKTFNTEIVDCKRESGTTGVVPPRARSNRDRCMTAWSAKWRRDERRGGPKRGLMSRQLQVAGRSLGGGMFLARRGGDTLGGATGSAILGTLGGATGRANSGTLGAGVGGDGVGGVAPRSMLAILACALRMGGPKARVVAGLEEEGAGASRRRSMSSAVCLR
jgi:hypothetical protein